MNKKLLISFVIVIVLLAAGYWYWKSTQVVVPVAPEQANLNQVGNSVKAVTDSVTQGVLPSLAVPDTNPVSKTNPFSGLRTNPFGQ